MGLIFFIINIQMYSRYILIILVRFNELRILSSEFKKKISNINFQENSSVGAEFFHVGRETEGRKDMIS